MPKYAPRQCNRCRRPFIGRLCPCLERELLAELLAAANEPSDEGDDTAPVTGIAPEPDPHSASADDVELLYDLYVNRPRR
ncbi:hypothetical protein AK37_05557 [Rhodococcus pyridinivorans AK37]|uniref:Uncharacterized protein n=2 Tax=Rhodococcus pyridinivorans TaxID=103816 RepID=H0JNC8_9NOCA|nr:hypothetical protein AK37_05557 [Rhodococcus pyridinivorans AK37]